MQRRHCRDGRARRERLDMLVLLANLEKYPESTLIDLWNEDKAAGH
ncbi:hypothetical protein MTX26_27470 [Bradyrhizobium sp. ISRA443]|nr:MULTISPECIES: hypothetical protein [unclassified Bradyrhizobium]WGR93461.1 hypothetical protein MTX20_02300 [Bradyrhizobium sp. ISRA435]WGR98011.1 hypothetical protein MTX23_27460 [Bradyrhizobium sp. ISRA436]WGS04900.1 hypothetical protein MTX18_27465 [Bradyrhizobium sp. ISRA437]WGS11784.1 hypothetical protein MTX26_27470 [Bradyrhizobium sp. ISRA443]